MTSEQAPLRCALCDTAVVVGSETIYWKRRDARSQTGAWKQLKNRRALADYYDYWGFHNPRALYDSTGPYWDPDGTQGGIPICWRCVADRFDWRCPYCQTLVQQSEHVCAVCTEQLTRLCSQCGQPFMAVPTWEISWTPMRGSPSQTMCSECHAQSPRLAHSILTNQLKRARKNGRRATLTLEQWTAAIAYFDYRCAYCQLRPFAQMDHFLPVHKRGGGTTADNCLPVCRACNTSKQRTHPDVWLQRHSELGEQPAHARAYLAQMRRGEQPRHNAVETATLALSEPTRWGRFIVVRVSDWPEQVHDFHPLSRVHWRNAGTGRPP